MCNLYSYLDKASFNTDWPQTIYVAEDDHDLLLLLALPPESWDCKLDRYAGFMEGWKSNPGFLHAR